MRIVNRLAFAALLFASTFCAVTFAQNSTQSSSKDAKGLTATEFEDLKAFAENGEVDAQYTVGLLYAKGVDVERNINEAEKWWRKAASQGDARAQDSLGIMYGLGQGRPQNYAESIKWHTLAANQGYASAQYNLGYMYYNGLGFKKSYAEAYKLFMKAAVQADERSESYLGYMYKDGQGVAKDYHRAHMWFNISALNGESSSKQQRTELENKMTKEQIADAQDIARICVDSKYKHCY